MTATFDTLEFAERLRAGGFSEQQAKAATEAFAKATSQQLVTKADLREELLRLERRIDAVESGLGRRIDEVETALGRRIDEVEAALGRRIDGVEAQLGGRIDGVEGEIRGLRSDMQTMELRLLTRLGGVVVAGVGVIAAMVAMF